MKIIEGVYMLESTKDSHAYLIESEENIFIDTGFPGLSHKILSEIQDLGVLKESIRHILLTHNDVDHIGNAQELRQAMGAKLWASKEDIPYITGEKNRPGVKRIIQSIVKVKKPVVDGSYSPGQYFGEIKTISTPGHTPGHTIFAYRNVLFTGDMFKIINGSFKMLPKFMNWNQEQAQESLKILKQLDFEWLCPGHGEPIKRSRMVDSFLSLK